MRRDLLDRPAVDGLARGEAHRLGRVLSCGERVLFPLLRQHAERVVAPRLALVLLWIFLFAIALMGTAFKTFGKDFSEALLATTTNPVIGLMIGLLATSVMAMPAVPSAASSEPALKK